MDFKLPTFSSIVFGVIGGFFSLFMRSQILFYEVVTKISERIAESNLSPSNLEQGILFLSNPLVGILVGILAGFVVGLLLEWIFQKREVAPGVVKIKIWKKWWFWVIVAVLLVLIVIYLVNSYFGSMVAYVG